MTEQDMHQNDVDCVLVDKSIAVRIIEKLTTSMLLNHEFKIKELGSQVAIPVNKPETLVMFDWFDYDNISITQLDLVRNPHPKMCGATGLPMKNVPYYWIS